MLLPKRMLMEQVQAVSGLGTFVFNVILVFIFVLTKNFSVALSLFLSLVFIMFVGFFVKFFFFRPRPDKQKFRSLLEKVDASSFPSVHAARAVAVLVILGLFFHSFFWWFFLSVLAFLVGLSRIILKRHRLIDVLAGFVLGFLVGFLVCFLVF